MFFQTIVSLFHSCEDLSMDKELKWATLQEDEGKFALGYILTKEMQSQALLRGAEDITHVGVFVTIDLLGNLKIGPLTPFLPSEMENMKEEDKIKLMLRAGLSEQEIISLLTDQ